MGAAMLIAVIFGPGLALGGALAWVLSRNEG